MTEDEKWERLQRKLENCCPGCGIDLDHEFEHDNKCDECHARLVKEMKANIKMLDSAQDNDKRYIQVSVETIAEIAKALSDKK